MILLAILALLAVLAARADASPSDGEDVNPAPAPTDATEADPDLETEPVPGMPFVRAPVAASELRRAVATAPNVAAVVAAAAIRAAGLDHDPAQSWRRRARLAALVPWVSIRDGRDATWHDVADPTIGYVSVLMASATWHFDRLVFEPSELRIAAIDVSRRRERRRVAELAVHAYYDWLYARAAAGREPRWQARADEAAAEVDALTDRWFSEAIAKPLEPR